MRTALLLFATLLAWLANAQTDAAKPTCIIAAKDLVDPSAPQFSQYPSKVSTQGSPVKLDLSSNPIAKMFRTVIRHEMTQGANFAGHYRVVIWGCGSSCAQFAVVNLNTGRVITAPAVENV